VRIAVLGAGGGGGYFGARRALVGNGVTFVARGGHPDAIERDGLRIVSDSPPMHVRSAKATSDPASIGAIDVALLCVKLWDVEAAARSVAPHLGHRSARTRSGVPTPVNDTIPTVPLPYVNGTRS